ncbi:sugar ABC transporter ATP-binding protein [Thermoclostridium stercorarium subsp. thermolacticum DSM 2910]|uniref:Autoinducer 2 import ATP-binding protein LsrA n=1 Tax=Thermoclostridium stercorarium subsp. thermolacticum DSM 2910 TaxID=1121336 RepID=A0A1B1YG56_THEST|nr:sugar ABC transporter ATP-binding protein [Thermoclostridium stercorarium]ANW99754.1 sugar ABC transporter ATP-binding protein [Thermoclostridium stercorarium subsp. thermolacticum DSM 2910]
MDIPVLKLENVNLRIENFSLSGINLDLYSNEIHVIMGENRSGKSLLMHVVSGQLPPDSGRFFLKGRELKYSEYSSAVKKDITYVRQESEMLTNLTIAENLFFNNLPYKNRFLKIIDYNKLNYMCRKLLDEFNLPISINDRVSSLGLAQRQICEVLRAYVSEADIVILDEPFAALTQNEKELMCNVVKSIRERGAGIFYITHSLDDVFLLGDRITIIRDGRIVDTRKVADCTRDEIIRLISGRQIKNRYPKIRVKTGDVILSVRDLCFEDKLQNISFDLRKGEILGVTGLAGSGRTLLAKCLFGAVDNVKGKIFINGSEVKISDPYIAISNGIALIPEDRINYSIFSYLSVSDNISVSSLKRFAHALKINTSILTQSVMEYIKKLNITQDPRENILEYSSGNQQKAVFAKWIMNRAKIFILDEPTRGLDIASKIDIYNFINDLVKKEVGVIFISSDIEEILGICDRVAVLSSRTLACNVSTKDITVEKIIELATKDV